MISKIQIMQMLQTKPMQQSLLSSSCRPTIFRGERLWCAPKTESFSKWYDRATGFPHGISCERWTNIRVCVTTAEKYLHTSQTNENLFVDSSSFSPLGHWSSHCENLSLGWANTFSLSAYAWGCNTNGQLGIGNLVNSLAPALVLANNIVSVHAGNLHSCLHLNDGQVQCMGQDQYGQLGQGTVSSTNPNPLTVNTSSFLSPVSEVIGSS
jgi:hypothetical protein